MVNTKIGVGSKEGVTMILVTTADQVLPRPHGCSPREEKLVDYAQAFS